MKAMKTLFVAVTILFLCACGQLADFNSVKKAEVLSVLSLPSNKNSEWAGSQELYVKNQNPARWSPYVWASNAAALSSLSGQETRLKKTITSLLEELQSNTVSDEDGNYQIEYTYPYPFDGFVMNPPWHSAFANAAAAIGLMHIRDVSGDKSHDDRIEKYLDAIPRKFSDKNERGSVWFSEYVSVDAPNGHINVVNGHFFAVGAMYAWRETIHVDKYDKYISQGLDTMERELPSFIQDGYFSYAEGMSHIKDYGQLRAVNYAVMSCKLRRTICPTAVQYQELFYKRWK